MGETKSKSAAPIRLKNGIAILDPEPIARGSFGEVYTGRIQNPIGLLAERIVRGEEDPVWLGIEDLPFQDPGEGLPKPIPDPGIVKRIYQAAQKLWAEYLERCMQDRAKADEEFKDILSLLDPMLLGEKTVAVKVLRPPLELGRQVVEESVRRFIKENDMLRRLQHPGIVRRLGLIEDPSMGWCLIMEFVAGQTLDDWQRKFPERRVPLPVAAQIARDLADALSYSHHRGIIHRDLKPQNVMVRDDSERAVIMDFGIGKWSDEKMTQSVTMPGARIGTPRYMAPEQVMGGRITAATDVYQLCTVLFEAVAGHAAYEGLDQDAIFTWLTDRNRRHPLYISELVPGISRELEALIEVGREKDPERRWAMEEFRELLEQVVADGRYDRKDRSGAMTPTELATALQRTRIRKKVAHWEEQVLETKLHFVNLQARVEEARAKLGEKAYEDARTILQEVELQIVSLPARYDPLRTEVERLRREVDVAMALKDAEDLLAQAEKDYAEQRYPEVGVRLRKAAQQLALLPEEPHARLHGRYQSLNDRYEGAHKSFVDLFDALRKSFVVKIQQRYEELHERYGAGKPVDPGRVMELLEQVTMAESNLKLIQRDKIGPPAYDRTARDLAEQREALTDLLKRIGPA